MFPTSQIASQLSYSPFDSVTSNDEEDEQTSSMMPPPQKKRKTAHTLQLSSFAKRNPCFNARIGRCVNDEESIKEYENGRQEVRCTRCNLHLNINRAEKYATFKKWDDEFLTLKDNTCEHCHQKKLSKELTIYTPKKNLHVLSTDIPIKPSTREYYWTKKENFNREKYMTFLTTYTNVYCKGSCFGIVKAIEKRTFNKELYVQRKKESEEQQKQLLETKSD